MCVIILLFNLIHIWSKTKVFELDLPQKNQKLDPLDGPIKNIPWSNRLFFK